MVVRRVSRRQLEELYKLSPIPVEEIEFEEDQDYYGLYSRRPKKIFIDMHLFNYQKVSIFLHELGHHKCEKLGCYCCKLTTNIVAEAHAQIYSIVMCAKLGLKKSEQWGRRSVEDALSRPSHYPQETVTSAKLFFRYKDFKKIRFPAAMRREMFDD
jgi:hypothetical protein